MTKKKVLFTSHTANFQKFNRPFMRMLSEQGYEVHYASMGEEEILDADKSFAVPFTRSPFRLSNVKAYKQLKEIIDRENYDIIHTHTPMGGVVTRLAARDARKKGTRVIYTAHGFHFYKGAPLLNWLIYYPVEKWMAKHTDTLITINNEDFERAKRKKFKTDVQYVPGVGVDPKRFEPRLTKRQRNELRASLGLKPEDFVMIYPAELNKNKNQTMLIKVMEKLMKERDDIHLLLAGKDSLNGYHERHVAKKGLGRNVHLLGYRSDIPELLMASDLSVSASHREGLPVHIMEAMQSKLPVVTTKCRGATELIEDSANGHVTDFDDTESMTKNIMKIITDGRIREKMSRKSFIKAGQYSIDHILNLHDSIYKNTSIKHAEPLRILHVVTVMNRAGLETMLMNYYRNMDRSKIQFDFIVHREEEGAYDKEILSLGGRIYKFSPITARSMITYRRRIKKFLLGHPEYKIVHSHLDSLSALPLSGAKDAGIPVRIAHSHVNNFDKNIDVVARSILKRLIHNYATRLMACSQAAGEFMFGKKSNFDIIYNAIDESEFTFNADTRKTIRKELGLSDNFVVGHVGRFEFPKNHTFLLDTFAIVSENLPEARLVLVGGGSLEGVIKDKIEKLGLSSKVVVLGPTSSVANIMQAFDVFTLPSIYEGLGMVAIEAQAAGLPVIASTGVSGEANISSDFLSVKLDPELWSNAIRELSSNHQLTPASFNEKYSIKKAVKILSDVYIRSSP